MRKINVGGKPYRTIWLGGDARTVEIIDQTRLPHKFVTVELRSVDDAIAAIKTMQVRGAPLIGATAAYGMALAVAARDTANLPDGMKNLAFHLIFQSDKKTLTSQEVDKIMSKITKVLEENLWEVR